MDIYAQTSSYQSEGRFLIRFIEERAVVVQGAQPWSQNTERCSKAGLFPGYLGLPQSRGCFASAAHPAARGTTPAPGTQPQGGGEGLAGFCGENAPGTRWWLSGGQVPTLSRAICAVKICPLYGSSDPGTIFLCRKTTLKIKGWFSAKQGKQSLGTKPYKATYCAFKSRGFSSLLKKSFQKILAVPICK